MHPTKSKKYRVIKLWERELPKGTPTLVSVSVKEALVKGYGYSEIGKVEHSYPYGGSRNHILQLIELIPYKKYERRKK